uniref:C-type lectin domain-containing protein n=1 Tax=Panagrolaimus sp. JU765 TaxID=591449 RepID=A0AC34Q4V2_9BILA
MVSAGPCPDDTWRYSPHSNKCYKLFNEKTGWNLGEFRCAFKGGHHLSIHDQIENQFVSELAKQADLVWLGIAQFGTNQNYVWSDSTSFDYENWHAKHNYRKPVYNKGRKCAKLEGHTGTWMQSCCKVPAAYICEREATVATTTPTPTTVPTTPWWLNPINIAESNTNELRKFRFRRL